METNKIYNEDCLKGMKKLPDNSIDLIITSPPYNLGNNHHTGNKKINPYDDDKPEREYQEWQIKILNECYRILKKNGSLMYNHKNRIKNGKQISPYEWLFKTKFIVKQEIVWENGSQNFDKIRFYPFTERVYWLAKSRKTKLKNTINKQDIFYKTDWSPVGTDGKHKRAFPLKMAKDLIKVFPNSKVVLDPFMGSGTVALASLQEGKKFIGYELEEEYYKIALKRIGKFNKNYYNELPKEERPAQMQMF